MKERPESRRREIRALTAFTLVELLVVIAIIAILFGLITGGLVRGKMAAKRIACINNLRQWAGATHLYAADNEDRLPREDAIDGINSWDMTRLPMSVDVWYNALPDISGITRMSDYAQAPAAQQEFYSRRNIFHCPSAQFSEIAATYPNFSLAINSKLMRDFEKGVPTAAGAPPPQYLSDIRAPSRTALFLDNGVPGEARLCAFQAPYTGQPKSFASQFSGRHNRAGNIVFADGHALTLAGKEVVEMNPTSPFRGQAIFPPIEVVWRGDPGRVP